MLITVTTNGEDLYNLELDGQMTIEDLKALLEDEVNLFLKNLTVGYSLFIHLKSLVFR
jgi:hypothetical protein